MKLDKINFYQDFFEKLIITVLKISNYALSSVSSTNNFIRKVLVQSCEERSQNEYNDSKSSKILYHLLFYANYENWSFQSYFW